MTENNISIQMGREELVSLLNVLGVKGMLGLGEDYLTNYSEEGQRQILLAGTNALRAKGWLREEMAAGEARLGVDGVILALVGTCLSAGRLVYISHWPKESPPRIWYVHLGEHMTVIHRTTLPGVHELWASVSPEDVLAEIVALLQVEKTAAVRTDAKLVAGAAQVERLLALARGEGEARTAVEVVAEAGFAGEGGEALVTAVRNTQANSVVSFLELQNGNNGAISTTTAQTFSLLRSDRDLWLIEALAEDGANLSLAQTTAENVRVVLGRWLGLGSDPSVV